MQGVPTPLIVQTKVEKVRVIKLRNGEYNLLRSFVESSLKEEYEWRTALEYSGEWVWRKEKRWELEVYKNVKPVENFKELPVKGIYKIIDKTISPMAVLRSLRANAEIWFVIANNELGIYYSTDTVNLAFSRRAPVVFAPKTPIPFVRPIPAYEVFDTLDYYFTF